MNTEFIIKILILGLFSVSCGYTTHSLIYNESRIFIEPVINKIKITYEDREYSKYRTFPILLEKKLTNALIKKFNIDGHLKVVNEEEGALRLTCIVKDYRRESLRYTGSEDVKEQRLWLYVDTKLVDSQGRTLKEKEIVGWTSFFLSGTNKKSEASAQEDLIDDTARRILEAVIEEW